MSKSKKPYTGHRRPWEGSRGEHVRIVGRECPECQGTVRHASWCVRNDG